MRIVHLLKGRADPDTMNGVNRVVHHLADEMAMQGHDVQVWGIARDPNQVQTPRQYPLRLFGSSRARIVLEPQLRSSIREAPADTVFHLHSSFVPEFVAVAAALRRRGMRWVVTPHGGYEPHAMMRNRVLKSTFVALFDRQVLGRARSLHAVSDAEKENLEKLVPGNRVVSIPNGQGKIAFSRSRRMSSPEPLFIFCGRIDRVHKGLDLMLDGFERYVAAGGSGNLSIIGGGPDREWLQHRSEKVSGRVSVLGPAFGEQKINLLANADAFLMTSRWEGFPMGILEAWALGLPTVVSPETNVAEVVASRSLGVALASNQPSDIAAGLFEFERVLRSGGAPEMRQNVLSEIESGPYAWSKVATRVVQELYEPGNHALF